ncbi:MAG: hypothetical protein ABEI06_00615, partial [Halobacteriaceae archaeon]
METVNRRHLLKSLGVGIGGLAGCTGSISDRLFGSNTNPEYTKWLGPQTTPNHCFANTLPSHAMRGVSITSPSRAKKITNLSFATEWSRRSMIRFSTELLTIDPANMSLNIKHVDDHWNISLGSFAIQDITAQLPATATHQGSYQNHRIYTANAFRTPETTPTKIRKVGIGISENSIVTTRCFGDTTAVITAIQGLLDTGFGRAKRYL